MKVIPLKRNPNIYSCRAYLVLGDWNRLEDVNTLVDVGSDGYVLDEIGATRTGCGKNKVEQVVLTHGHFDHAKGLSDVRKNCRPVVRAFSDLDGVDAVLNDGQSLRMGDREFEVIHVPFHSNDSICLYCAEEHVLFSGDTPVRIRTADGSYPPDFISVIERLANLQIEAIYSGHDEPVISDAGRVIRATLKNIDHAA